MKNYSFKIYTAILSVILIAFTSCEKYLDINTDPNRIASGALASQLTGTLTSTASNHFNAAFTINQITQHIAAAAANGSADTHNEIRLAGVWTGTYLNAMTNLADIIKTASEKNSPHYAGIAKILTAINLGMTTDIWGDVPYSDAFKLQSSFYPKYDTQQDVYNAINTLLNEALTDLNATTNVFKPGADDLFFAGNITRWRKLANAIKARYAIHLTKKNGAAAAEAAITAIASGMTDNADDAQVAYNNIVINPWHSLALALNTGNTSVRHSDQLAESMNGGTYGVWDPRLPIIAGARPNVSNNTWKGTVNGSGSGGVLDFLVTNWYSTQTSPILIMTFSEQKFIEAEARFIANGGNASSTGTTAAAYKAYIDGIDAHMKKLGVADTARNRYLKDPKVDVGAANLKLEHIMSEKWKALFLQSEVWTDMRRYDYSQNIYKGLELPQGHNPSLGGQWIRRAEYPLDEYTRNSDQVRKVQKRPIDKLWWDQ